MKRAVAVPAFERLQIVCIRGFECERENGNFMPLPVQIFYLVKGTDAFALIGGEWSAMTQVEYLHGYQAGIMDGLSFCQFSLYI